MVLLIGLLYQHYQELIHMQWQVLYFYIIYSYDIDKGIIQTMSFNYETKDFYLSYIINPLAKKPTEIYLNEKIHYSRILLLNNYNNIL